MCNMQYGWWILWLMDFMVHGFYGWWVFLSSHCHTYKSTSDSFYIIQKRIVFTIFQLIWNTKRNSVWGQIKRKMVIEIRTWFNLTLDSGKICLSKKKTDKKAARNGETSFFSRLFWSNKICLFWRQMRFEDTLPSRLRGTNSVYLYRFLLGLFFFVEVFFLGCFFLLIFLGVFFGCHFSYIQQMEWYISSLLTNNWARSYNYSRLVDGER